MEGATCMRARGAGRRFAEEHISFVTSGEESTSEGHAISAKSQPRAILQSSPGKQVEQDRGTRTAAILAESVHVTMALGVLGEPGERGPKSTPRHAMVAPWTEFVWAYVAPLVETRSVAVTTSQLQSKAVRASPAVAAVNKPAAASVERERLGAAARVEARGPSAVCHAPLFENLAVSDFNLRYASDHHCAPPSGYSGPHTLPATGQSAPTLKSLSPKPSYHGIY